MKVSSLILALAAFVAGVIAAWRWYQSSIVPIDPGWGLPGSGRGFEPSEESAQAIGWAVATIGAFNQASDLNRKAALWTAVSVGLSAASAVTSALA